MKKTKLVCTLGPASSTPEVMRAMLEAGMNVARFNFSHGTHETHGQMIDTFRKVREELDIPAAVLLDTKGPEIRLGLFKGGRAEIRAGEEYTLTTRDIEGDCSACRVSYAGLPGVVKPGDALLIDDGRVRLEVEAADGSDIRCRVRVGGALKDRKSVNAPGVKLDMPYLSDTDKSDLLFGIEKDVDFVAASFVRRPEDVIAMRRFLDYHGGHGIRIIAKIENTEGVNNFDAILALADGIMVARGDMGVEIAYECLPGLQKRFIRKCCQAGKMSITATQMLESMVSSPTPTRAEITDVANAVFDGTSAVMLSAESASGKYPVEAVRTMARVAVQAERDAFDMNAYAGFTYDTEADDTTNAICDAACAAARDLRAKTIIAVTMSGRTARRMSKFRPIQPIVAATPVAKTFHQLALSWGVYPSLALCQHGSEALFRHAVDCAKQLDMAAKGDLVVITGGSALDTSGTTNTVRAETVN